jgi:hypothetical protein
MGTTILLLPSSLNLRLLQSFQRLLVMPNTTPQSIKRLAGELGLESVFLGSHPRALFVVCDPLFELAD